MKLHTFRRNGTSVLSLRLKYKLVLRCVSSVVAIVWIVQVHSARLLSRSLSPTNRDELAKDLSEEMALAVSQEEVAASSATGVLFSGRSFRTFQGERYFQPGSEIRVTKKKTYGDSMTCERWAVVTTILGPTEAVKLVPELDGWCTVVVADRKTPNNYIEQANPPSPVLLTFLSIKDQEEWAVQLGETGTFVRNIPYNHFARKSIGYLYAIQHGAKFIFDFDDDNILGRDERGNLLSPLKNETHLQNARTAMQAKHIFNSHPLMGASLHNSWARGFPLELVLDETTQGSIAFESDFSMKRIGVMQLCANGDPDIDAVHRLTKPLPMHFRSERDGGQPVVVPKHVFAPYNAQATLHTVDALWALLLPSTVPGRVSDIWRGYFAEALFRDLDLAVAYLPPRITQDRNAHNYLADMEAESDLYLKAGTLIRFLSGWSNNALETIPARMEGLWIDLYERGYIEEGDVKMVQRWLSALCEIGYEFPRFVRRRYNNVVLMGQFNYGLDLDSVIFWNQKWRETFYHTVVRGPFNEIQIAEMSRHGIDAHYGDKDSGFFSPVENLALTLRQYKDVEGIDGVLYAHDDALINIQNLTMGLTAFPSHAIIGTDHDELPMPYEDMTKVMDAKAHSRVSYSIHQNGTFSNAQGHNFQNDWKALARSLVSFPGYRLCIPPLMNVAADPSTNRYKNEEGALLVPAVTQADFFYVPMALVGSFIDAAELMIKHKVFLECAFPTIVQMLRRIQNIEIRTISLCTGKMSQGSRGNQRMIDRCKAKRPFHGVYHPYKLSVGLQKWNAMFNSLSYE